MKTFKSLVAGVLLTGALFPITALADSAKTDTYPLKTCVVSGEKLGEMGKPYSYTYEGREIRFCCKGCVKDFKADPAKFLKKLDAAQKAADEPAKK